MRVTAGLLLAGALGVFDLSLPVMARDGHPPMAIAAVSAVLGAATLVAVIVARRQGMAGARQGMAAGRWGARRWFAAVAGSRVLSALSAAGALPATGVPGAVRFGATAEIALTVVAIILLAPPLRRPVEAGQTTPNR